MSDQSGDKHASRIRFSVDIRNRALINSVMEEPTSDDAINWILGPSKDFLHLSPTHKVIDIGIDGPCLDPEHEAYGKPASECSEPDCLNWSKHSETVNDLTERECEDCDPNTGKLSSGSSLSSIASNRVDNV